MAMQNMNMYPTGGGLPNNDNTLFPFLHSLGPMAAQPVVNDAVGGTWWCIVFASVFFFILISGSTNAFSPCCKPPISMTSWMSSASNLFISNFLVFLRLCLMYYELIFNASCELPDNCWRWKSRFKAPLKLVTRGSPPLLILIAMLSKADTIIKSSTWLSLGNCYKHALVHSTIESKL